MFLIKPRKSRLRTTAFKISFDRYFKFLNHFPSIKLSVSTSISPHGLQPFMALAWAASLPVPTTARVTAYPFGGPPRPCQCSRLVQARFEIPSTHLATVFSLAVTSATSVTMAWRVGWIRTNLESFTHVHRPVHIHHPHRQDRNAAIQPL